MRWWISLLFLACATADRWRGVNGTCPGTAFKRQAASNVEQCKRHCEAFPSCQGVSYNHQRTECVLLAQAEAANRTTRCYNQHVVEVFVMMPLDLVSLDGTLQEDKLTSIWSALEISAADGFMVDVWWGITEPEPKKYHFAPYRRLIDEAKARNFKVQIVSSFHQCGGNVGDACNIPLPEFVRNVPDIWYKDAKGTETKEYISLFADEVPVAQRTPLQMYRDWFKAFKKEFKKELKGGPIVEIMVGLGPCGEMRYPSYPLDRWNFPGIGSFQCFDHHALKSLRTAAGDDSIMPPVVEYNDSPQDTIFFSLNSSSNYESASGHFFLEWYSGALKRHAADVLSLAHKVYKKKVRLAAKISGIHWWYNSWSHAAEVTTGYYNTNGHNAYLEIAKVLKDAGADIFDFTCLEMRDTEQPEQAHSSPEQLVRQSQAAVIEAGLHFAGENALERYDQYAYDQMLVYKENLFALTYLRMTETLMQPENLQRFRCFVFAMHGDESDCSIPSARRLGLTGFGLWQEVKHLEDDYPSAAQLRGSSLILLLLLWSTRL